MDLVTKLLTRNDCYKKGAKLEPKGLMIHSTGTAQPKASAYISLWNNPGYLACVHAFIDGNTGTVYQTLPWRMRGWHGASGPKGSVNDTHIGVEMCEPADIKYISGAQFAFPDSKVKAIQETVYTTYQSAVELFAMLCKEFNLDPLADGVVISHSEGHKRGIASNHADVEHLWCSPLLKMGLTMDGFRKDITLAMGGVELPATNTMPPVPFMVRVEVGNLLIRSGPGTNKSWTGKYTGPGVFTIVDVAQGAGSDKGWGLLKSYKSGRNGWISLDYCEVMT